MALCSGCQKFRDGVFSPEPIAESSGELFVIHENYAELSSCADSCCEMCRYLCRELWFYCYDNDCYIFRPHFEDADRSIVLRLPGKERVPLYWQLIFGEEYYGYFRKFGSGSRKVVETRRASETPEHIQDMGREWLTTCCTQHKHCEPLSDDGKRFLPTRLLDIGIPGQRSIRLVHSDETQEMQYATLSYCWGNPENAARTTKANLTERLEAIPVESLPQTIQDAVEVTRSLGIRYLWVDALCIIQVTSGVNDDWQRELTNMGKIYKYSLFTIAASGAENSSVGLYSRIEPARWPVKDNCLSGGSLSLGGDGGLIMEATQPNWNIAVEGSALSRRGWVLQERMSASRSLFFTDEGVFWQCNELKTSEYGLLVKNSMFPDYPTMQELVQSFKGGDEDELWTKLVGKFTEKSLTVATDRLPAITGLATNLAGVSGRNHSAGVFEQSIHRELAWHVSDISETPGQRLPGVPSWSWATSNQPVRFVPYKKLSLKFLPTKISMSERQIRAHACVGNLVVTRSTAIKAAGLKTNPYKFSSHDYTIESNTSGHKFWLTFDTLLDALPKEGGTIFCVQWCNGCNDDESDRLTGALIVAPVDGEESTYRRRGWAYIRHSGVFLKQEPRDIILV
ncbi:heterokaryon incompatibility protein-domain-containing protein [Boeremia exigua]|uniref:heterokaryon incompatibility protein-domain-containing protein n=1 Tax=Boeremia exigua TaxID=749465 RepID=UPI001E8D7445|nr:heterokaryon incompatibility protein-domain-containing protein [Boeremia exigua]KAH6615372.1 heterokaryon incompatibility protein-domain-containing protein [Boeremia exigua]